MSASSIATPGSAEVLATAQQRVLRHITLENPAQVRAIWSQWDDLAVAAGRPYGSPAWMMAWWQHVAPPGSKLRVIAVFDGEELVGVAPFSVDRGPGGVRRYRFLGAGTCAPVDLLVSPGAEQRVAPVVARALAEATPTPDTIMFEGVRGDSPWPRLLCDCWPRRGKLRLHSQFAQPAPFVELEGRTYDDWFATKTSNLRRKIRHELKVMREHGASVRFSANADELTRDLHAFAELHRARWNKRGGSGVLDERVERMVADAASQLLEQGRFRLVCTVIDGRTIAADIVVSAGGESAYWLGGFDENEPRLRRPGIMNVRAALEHAFSVGDRHLDLGPGGQPYKSEFSKTQRTVEWILLVRSGLRSFPARAQMASMRARIVVAQRLSPELKQAIRRVRAWRPSWSRSQPDVAVGADDER